MDKTNPIKRTLTYSGFVRVGWYKDNSSALLIGNTPVVEEIAEELNYSTVSVRYWLSDSKKTKEELIMGHLKSLYGEVDSEYRDRYGEMTGYLWTDEELKIGGHDLLHELSTYEDKYILLEIDVH